MQYPDVCANLSAYLVTRTVHERRGANRQDQQPQTEPNLRLRWNPQTRVVSLPRCLYDTSLLYASDLFYLWRNY